MREQNRWVLPLETQETSVGTADERLFVLSKVLGRDMQCLSRTQTARTKRTRIPASSLSPLGTTERVLLNIIATPRTSRGALRKMRE